MSNNTFFDKFPGFEPDLTAPIEVEFERLALHMGWRPESKKWRKNRKHCLESEFVAQYGNDASKLQNWQNLCREVRVRQAIESISQCKKVCRKTLSVIIMSIDPRIDLIAM